LASWQRSGAGPGALLAALNLAERDHEPQRLIHRRFVRKCSGDVRLEPDQVRASAITFYVLAAHATLEKLGQVVFGPQFVIR